MLFICIYHMHILQNIHMLCIHNMYICVYPYIHIHIFIRKCGNFTHLWRWPWKLINMLGHTKYLYIYMHIHTNIHIYVHILIGYICIYANPSFSIYENPVGSLSLHMHIYVCMLYTFLFLIFSFLFPQEEEGREQREEGWPKNVHTLIREE